VIAALLRKELRALAPFVLLVTLLWGLDLVLVPISEFPDAKPLSEWVEDVIGSEFNGLAVFVVAFSLAMGLLVGERDRGTLELLDSLPVSRTSVFAVKLAAAVGILACGPIATVVVAAFFHALSRDSLDPGFHPGTLAASVFLHTFQSMVFLAWGLFLSFLRRLAWIAAALLYLTLVLLRELDPALAVLDPMSLSVMSFEGQAWLPPWRLLAVQAAIAAVLTALAWLLFLGAGERLLRAGAALRETRGGRLFLGALSVGAVCAWMVVGAVRSRGEAEAAPDGEAPSPVSRLTTEAYVFTFPESLQERARTLAASAGSVDDTVRRFFGAERLGGITVDATGIRASAGASGLALWKSVRLDLGAAEDTEDAAAVLGHETAHVYAAALSDRRVRTPFFDEGLAEYIEGRFFRPPAFRERHERLAAVLHARKLDDFEDLMDPERVTERMDPDVVYPLGATFVSALVEVYGDDAPARVLRALGRENVPELDGMEQWQDAFQEAGFDLDAAADHFYARLDEAVARHAALVDDLPRPRGRLQREAGTVAVVAELDGPVRPGQTTTCRFRSDRDEPRERFFLGGSEGGRCWATRGSFTSGVVHYQLGLYDARVGTVWEPWSEAPLAGAGRR
jgi:ABC-2 family transporter protein